MADSETLLTHASAMIAAGRTVAAGAVLAAARATSTGDGRLAELGALLNIREGHWALARDGLDRDISTWPAHLALRKLRAEVRLRMQDMPGALADAADCVLAAPDDPAAKALLGMILLESGQADDASTCLREAVRDMPGNPGFVQALATAQEAMGDPAASTATLLAGIKGAPGNAALRNAAMLLAIRQRDFAHAVALAASARGAGVADACMFGLLGHALSHLGRHTDAADAYQEALKLGPDDPYVRHLVAASGQVASADRAPDDYIRTVFDGYAARFEQHLIDLGYRVPGLVRTALLFHRPDLDAARPIGPVLDLGCGTGLVAVATSDLPLRHLVGVDLSPRMLAQAERKGVYSELHAAEIGTYLRGEGRQFPLVIAADVLCYFGDLAVILPDIANRISIGGLLIFSVEEMPADQQTARWTLGQQGRYMHAPAYVLDSVARAGLQLREMRRETLRKEAGAAVQGLILITERAA